MMAAFVGMERRIVWMLSPTMETDAEGFERKGEQRQASCRHEFQYTCALRTGSFHRLSTILLTSIIKDL